MAAYENIGKLVLVYVDESGGTHEQPAADLVEVGTLIDPGNGDDMELVGYRLE